MRNPSRNSIEKKLTFEQLKRILHFSVCYQGLIIVVNGKKHDNKKD